MDLVRQVVEILIANNDNCVKDRAYIRLLRGNRSIVVLSGLYGDGHDMLPIVRHLNNGRPAFIRNSVHGRTLVARVLRSRTVSAIVRFTKLGTINRSMRGPLRCCSGGIGNALHLVDTVHTTGIGGFVFDSSTAICNSRPGVPCIRDFPANAPRDPCNGDGLVIRRVLASLRGTRPS